VPTSSHQSTTLRLLLVCLALACTRQRPWDLHPGPFSYPLIRILQLQTFRSERGA
jgi:hypothetical protein